MTSKALTILSQSNTNTLFITMGALSIEYVKLIGGGDTK